MVTLTHYSCHVGPLTNDNYEMDNSLLHFSMSILLEQPLGNAEKILINNFMIVADVKHSGYEILENIAYLFLSHCCISTVFLFFK